MVVGLIWNKDSVLDSLQVHGLALAAAPDVGCTYELREIALMVSHVTDEAVQDRVGLVPAVLLNSRHL